MIVYSDSSVYRMDSKIKPTRWAEQHLPENCDTYKMKEVETMTEQEAILAVRSRVRDFNGWTGNKGYRMPEIPTEEDAKFLQECFPHVKAGDPGAWERSGWKRIELDEALHVLGFPPLVDEAYDVP